MGADQCLKVAEDQVIRGDDPTTLKSKVGYLIAGTLEDAHPAQSIANVFR